jgi:hypothetical protein
MIEDVRRPFVTGLMLVIAVAMLAAEQGRRYGGFDMLRSPISRMANIPYDGRFTFVRIEYQTEPGGYWYRGQPAWSHGTPVAERNLMAIMNAITALGPHVDDVNVLSLDDPAIFKYPLLYIIEVGWWQMTDAEAAALRTYLQKGGFVIVDDFKLPGGIGGGGWDHFAANMQRVLPDATFFDLDVSHPIFHQFFDIDSLDIFPQAYNSGRPVFRALYEHNDTSQPMRMFVNYNTDISQFWEWSDRGIRPIDETNEAYKLGVNAILYGLTH